MVLITRIEKQHFIIIGRSFRPLAGIMVLISLEEVAKEEKIMASFRPLAGIMVLIKRTWQQMYRSWHEFPSPCGDYGSYQSMKFIV